METSTHVASDYADKTSYIYGQESWGKIFHQPSYTIDGLSNGVNEFADEMARMSYIDHSLAVLGITPEKLSTLNILDVGTGRQAIYMAKLGAKHVTHMDISKPNVERTNYYLKENKISNLTSVCGDLQHYPLPTQQFDFVFLAGIYQHLNVPAKGLINVANALKVGGQLYMGWYRSGEWRWFICELIRQLMQPHMAKEVKRQTSIAQCFGAAQAWQISRIMDDFFIPAHHEFHPRQIEHDAQICGLQITKMDNDYRDYSHEVTPLTGEGYERQADILDPNGTGNINLDYFSLGADRAYFEKVKHVDSIDVSTLQTQQGIDQIAGIDYQTPLIKQNLDLFFELKNLQQCGYLSDSDTVSIAINLYRLIRPTEPDKCSYYQKSLLLGRHKLLNHYLSNLVNNLK